MVINKDVTQAQLLMGCYNAVLALCTAHVDRNLEPLQV